MTYLGKTSLSPFFDKTIPSPLRQMVFDYVQPDREIPKLSLRGIRRPLEILELPKKENLLEYLYYYLSFLDDRQHIMSQIISFLRIHDVFNYLETKEPVSPKTKKIICDACYANFEDCLNKYESEHPKKSSRNAQDFLFSVPTTSLWVMKQWDPKAVCHFEKRFFEDYRVSFSKILDCTLIARGISLKNQPTQCSIRNLVSIIECERDNLRNLKSVNTKNKHLNSNDLVNNTPINSTGDKHQRPTNIKNVVQGNSPEVTSEETPRCQRSFRSRGSPEN